MTAQEIALALGAATKLVGVYLFIIAVIFLMKRPPSWEKKRSTGRFAVVIAARNEGRVIGRCVESLMAQRYPRELYEVFVVPNNCNDDTESVAARAGASIIRCEQPVSCKGDALNQAFEQLMADSRKFDAFCVFDADNFVDSGFLSAMNDALLAGAEVAKGRSEVLNPYDSWVSGCYGIYLRVFNRFYNRPRAASSLSAKLVGTAFMVSRSLLERLRGWNTVTLAEDAELSAQCVLAGERVWWVPEALAYDEAPTSFALSLRQRRRWVSGVMQVGSIKLGPLAGRLTSGSTGRARVFDLMVFFSAPYCQLAGLVCSAAALLLGPIDQTALLTALAGGALGWLAVSIAAAALAFTGERWDARITGSVLLFPLFMLSWLPLLLLSALCPLKKWDEIAHGVGRTERRKGRSPAFSA